MASIIDLIFNLILHFFYLWFRLNCDILIATFSSWLRRFNDFFFFHRFNIGIFGLLFLLGLFFLLLKSIKV